MCFRDKQRKIKTSKNRYEKILRTSVPTNLTQNEMYCTLNSPKKANVFALEGEKNLLKQLKKSDSSLSSSSKPLSTDANNKLKRLEMILGIRDDSLTLKPRKSQKFLTEDKKTEDYESNKKKIGKLTGFHFDKSYLYKEEKAKEGSSNYCSNIYRGSLDRALNKDRNILNTCLNKKFKATNLKNNTEDMEKELKKDKRKGKVYSSNNRKPDLIKNKRRVVPFGKFYKGETSFTKTSGNKKKTENFDESGIYKNKISPRKTTFEESSIKKPVKAHQIMFSTVDFSKEEVNHKEYRSTSNLVKNLNFSEIKLEARQGNYKREESTDCLNTPSNEETGIKGGKGVVFSTEKLDVKNKGDFGLGKRKKSQVNKSIDMFLNSSRGRNSKSPIQSKTSFKLFKARFLNISAKKENEKKEGVKEQKENIIDRKRSKEKEKSEFQDVQVARYLRLKNSIKLPNVLFPGNNYYTKDLILCYKPKNENNEIFKKNPKFCREQLKKSRSNIPKNHMRFVESFQDIYDTVSNFREYRPFKIGDINKRKFKLKGIDPKKLILVLDMDETLLHAKFLVGPRNNSVELELEPGKKFNVKINFT